MIHTRPPLRLALAALLATAAFAAPASGQCLTPDNLDAGTCGQAIDANLPVFPNLSLPGLGICWKDCAVDDANDLKVSLSSPVEGLCAEYKSLLTVADTVTGATLMTAPITMNYTRTWEELGPNNQQFQVWRFVVKADLSTAQVPGVVPVCPTPNCIAPFGPHSSAFYYGYVDYARSCGSAAFQSSLVLFHGCDFQIHKPGLSSRPGSFHPDRSYAIVAPHSAANPFVPTAIPAPGGPLFLEAIRNVNNPLGPFCTVEERIALGSMTPFAQGCLCDLATGPGQVTLTALSGVGSCPDAIGVPSSFSSQLIAFPTLPWPHMVQTSIGTWTGLGSYPGPEAVWVDEGLFRYRDSSVSTEYFEVFYGATTAKGFQVISPTPVPVSTFTDLVDNYSAPVSGPFPLPLMGHVLPSDHLIYVNTN